MEEHKVVPFRGSSIYEDGRYGTKCILQLDGLITKSMR